MAVVHIGNLGLVGWRGMVGSVLLERMLTEGDFANINTTLFSTSQAGSAVPEQLSDRIDRFGRLNPIQLDGYDVEALANHDVIISCQGGDYTLAVHEKLRSGGWKGYWIDAASTLRMVPSAIIVLDPVNASLIHQGIQDGVKDYIGGNCTVSLMLMALAGLFREDLVEWIASMTYQAASGAGAEAMKELLAQYCKIGDLVGSSISQLSALELDKVTTEFLRSDNVSSPLFSAPLATNLIPWIDKGVELGQTREEWKGFVETNRILGREHDPVVVDGTCVRVGALRCHSQALTIKLKRAIEPEVFTELLASGNEWVDVIENTRDSTVAKLSPLAVSGTLRIAVGRIRPMRQGKDYYTVFTVGDQLLWGAAEPLRRVFMMIKNSQ